MLVAHVSCVHDTLQRHPEALLAAWPTLGSVAQAVARAGAEVAVVQASHVDLALRDGAVRYIFVREPRLGRKRVGLRPARVAQAVASLAPTVVHLNGLDFPFHTRALCRSPAPVLVQDHGSMPMRRGPLRRWGLSRVGGVAFTSAAQADPFIEAGWLRPETPVFAVPESSTWFTPGDQDAARAATGVFGDPAVLWVGRLDANKDPLTVIDAIARAAARLPDVQLWCCFHESALLPEVHARLEGDAGLAKRVHLLGQIAHHRIEAHCRAADFFMAASGREGSGYAVIEAIACGATPILSDIAPFRALTGDGAIGALAPRGDAQAFADALVALASEPRGTLRARAAAHFDRALSFDVVGERLIDAYAALIGARA